MGRPGADTKPGPGPGSGPGAGPGAGPAAGKPSTTGRPAPGGKRPRKTQLQLARLEPWSVAKFSFDMSLVCFVILLVAVVVIYGILSALGVFDAIASTVNDLTREQGQKTGSLDAMRLTVLHNGRNERRHLDPGAS